MTVYRSRTPVMHHWRRHSWDLLSACGQCPGHDRVIDRIDTDHDRDRFLEFAVIARDKAAHGLICPKCASLLTGIHDTEDAHLFLVDHGSWTRRHDADRIRAEAGRITVGQQRSRTPRRAAGPALRRGLPIFQERPRAGS